MNSILIFATSTLLALISEGNSLTFFSGKGCKGFHLAISNVAEVPDMKAHAFDNMANSVKDGERWIFYEGASYNGQVSGAVEFVDPKKSVKGCYDFQKVGAKLSSARRLGTADNTPGIVFFDKDNFQGNTQYASQDYANLAMKTINSIVLKGNSPWTIFARQSFLGARLCLEPQEDADDQTTFIPNVANYETPIPPQFIQSLRKGCEPTF